MDYSNPDFWIAIGVGGSLIASLSAGQQWMNKETPFNTRAVIRDFCLGAFLTATLYMFLPESFHSWISAATSLLPVGRSQSGGGGVISSLSSSTADIELQVGPARF